MRRIFIAAGESKTISPKSAYICITGFHIDTNGTNDATLKIRGKGEWLTTPSGFLVVGTNETGGIGNIHPESGRCLCPVEISLSGTGSSAVIFCFESS